MRLAQKKEKKSFSCAVKMLKVAAIIIEAVIFRYCKFVKCDCQLLFKDIPLLFTNLNYILFFSNEHLIYLIYCNNNGANSLALCNNLKAFAHFFSLVPKCPAPPPPHHTKGKFIKFCAKLSLKFLFVVKIL
jgi:hypothetical protein